MNLDIKQFNFLSILTACVVLPYVFMTCYAFLTGKLTWEQYQQAAGVPALAILTYWLGGKKSGVQHD